MGGTVQSIAAVIKKNAAAPSADGEYENAAYANEAFPRGSRTQTSYTNDKIIMPQVC